MLPAGALWRSRPYTCGMSDPLRPSAEEVLAEWARRVCADREQVERYREEPERPDFYAPVAAAFKADPRREDDPVLDALRELVEPGDTWLDIGAGGGRFALPVALLAREVIALDASEAMLGILGEAMAEYGVSNVRPICSRWPMANAPRADVVLIANVGNDIEEIGPFLEAMEASARRLCVMINLARPPASYAWPLWPAIHGVEREPLPAVPEFLSLLLARGRLFEVRLFPRRPMSFEKPEDALPFLRQQLWIREGGEKDRRLRDLLPGMVQPQDGRYMMARGEPIPVALVTWSPR